jgi:hypothetical protein
MDIFFLERKTVLYTGQYEYIGIITVSTHEYL